MTTYITLVRHAESEDNKSGVFGGWRDVPLTDRGRAQCKALQRVVSVYRFDAVVTSGLIRAQSTAALILEQRWDAAAIRDSRWNEVAFGRWEGYSFSAVQDLYPEDVKAWLADPLWTVPPGGESFAMMYDRARAGLDDLLVRHKGSRVCIVSHGGPIRAALAYLLGLPLTFALHVDVNLASLCHVVVYDGHGVLHGLNIGGDVNGGYSDYDTRDRL